MVHFFIQNSLSTRKINMKTFILVSMFTIIQNCECSEDTWLSKIEGIKNIEDITNLQGVIIDAREHLSGMYS